MSRASSPASTTCPRIALSGLLLALAAGVAAQAPPATPEATTDPATAPVADPASATTTADLGQPFATKHAVFEPHAFDDLPGWREDSLREAADGMRQSCAALRRRSVWGQLCAQFADVSNGDPAGLHDFFERNFYAYQIMTPAHGSNGKLTGYFEPLLDGSRKRDNQYRYPVYGQPGDLLLLDARSAGAAAFVRDGHRLKGVAPGTPGAREYAVALAGAPVGVRDKRYRVRIENGTIVPYYSRQDIERRAIDAPVLAWVDDAHKLYSMQIQGSGKIRLREGGLVRVAYAEQNGHPFRPRITRGSDEAFALTEIKARGLIAGSSAGASIATASKKVSAPVNAEVARLIAQLKGTAPPPARPAPSPARPVVAASGTTVASAGRPAAGATSRQDVEAIIKALKGQGPAPRPRPVGDTGASVATASSARVDYGSATAGTATSGFAGGSTNIADPSYVFFRAIGDGPEGPIGALGVPLSAARSLAVDPRTTPLGAPVFISSIQPGGEGPMRKLMFAQDTGGAIRGSVRADFFWGFGDDAGRLALATNEVLQMWLLLPRQQAVAAVAASGMKLRGAKPELPECVVPDPELCVEE